ncbi:hypothetical protein [Streptomyces sp. NPDC002172]
MDDPGPRTPGPLRFLDGDADGLCDPATGVFAVPVAPSPGTAPTGSTGPTARSDGETANTATGC